MRGKTYQSYLWQKVLFLLVLLVILNIAIVFALNAGSMKLGFWAVVKGILGKGPDALKTVIWEIRLPRVAGAVLAGIGLGLAGNVQQVLLKNPLASPFTLGISQAAAFGAAFSIIVLGAGSYQTGAEAKIYYANRYLVSLTAFIFALLTSLIVLWLGKVKKLAPEAIALAGVAIGSLWASGTTLLQYFADELKLAAVVFWSFGDLGRLGLEEVRLLGVVISLAFIYFYLNRWNYNTLITGEEGARSLGVDPNKIRFWGMLISSGIAAVITSFCGIIGFIGLLAPHMVRRVIGNDQRFLLPGAALLGGVLLLLADTFARTVISPVILPVGAVTSFLGAPLFLYLLLRGK
ncbi:iron ABC transporter permease [Carboxydothermus islandicus]|uniref:Iron ABC transporter permease n=1 Tax=Carboxydothermus islandicus TaxID=661089 RepID=A0A1L8CZD4_9THEO|nr:iron ABC transporter permease [Carboxydothermus islandicus]GAV24292.1 iron ABC transporter permease [Carboxydothermus islandicus]